MKINLLLVCASMVLAGCSHFHEFDFPHTEHTVQTKYGSVPVDLSNFFLSNGLELVDQSKEVMGVRSYETINNCVPTAVWERLFKGWVGYDGSVGAKECWKFDTFIVYIGSNRREKEAEKIADNLRMYLAKTNPKVEVVYKKDSFVDLR